MSNACVPGSNSGIDSALTSVTAVLAGFGVLMVFDASAVSAALRDRFSDQYYFLSRQFVWFVVGLMVLMILPRLHIERMRNFALPAMLAGIILLLVVLIPGIGVERGGARRWLKIGSLSMQPGEFIRFLLVFYLAHFLARKEKELQSIKTGLVPVSIVSGIPVLLLALQPKFGSALILIILIAAMYFVAGIPLRHFLITLLALSPVAMFGLSRFNYISKRIDAWLNPSAYLDGISFQANQALIAIGSGGFLGVGLGQGRQKMFYLPEAHTDFIFPVISEELGFVGSFIILACFTFILFKGLSIAKALTDPFRKYLAFGLTVSVMVPVLINLCVATGLFPVTGVPLPLISFGGSALVTDMAAIGVLAGLKSSQIHPALVIEATQI